MLNINLFTQKKEKNVFGKVECDRNLVPSLLEVMNAIGLVNGVGVKLSSTKGVRITKKGRKYTMWLLNFVPPVKVQWQQPISQFELVNLIEKAIEDQKNICYINNISLYDNSNFFQVALA